MCSFIGLKFDPAILDFHKEPVMWAKQNHIRKGTGSNGPEHAALRNWQVNQPIFDGRGTWQGRLSPQQVSYFESGRGRVLMNALGYLGPTQVSAGMDKVEAARWEPTARAE